MRIVTGHEGCTLTHSHFLLLKRFLCVRVPREKVQIYGSSLHTLDNPKGIPQGHGAVATELWHCCSSLIFVPEISLTSSIEQDRKWCPVRALKWYQHGTKDICSSDRLFVLPRRPYSAEFRDTISYCLTAVIMAMPGVRFVIGDILCEVKLMYE